MFLTLLELHQTKKYSHIHSSSVGVKPHWVNAQFITNEIFLRFKNLSINFQIVLSSRKNVSKEFWPKFWKIFWRAPQVAIPFLLRNLEISFNSQTETYFIYTLFFYSNIIFKYSPNKKSTFLNSTEVFSCKSCIWYNQNSNPVTCISVFAIFRNLPFEQVIHFLRAVYFHTCVEFCARAIFSRFSHKKWNSWNKALLFRVSHKVKLWIILWN